MFLTTMRKLENEYHPRCYFNAMKDEFDVFFSEGGDLTAVFTCDERYAGYEGRMHGGIISSLFDWAMTHCLFGHGIKAYTVRLNIKFSHPVETGKSAEIRVTVKKNTHRNVHEMNAVLIQEGKIQAKATALFWEEKP